MENNLVYYSLFIWYIYQSSIILRKQNAESIDKHILGNNGFDIGTTSSRTESCFKWNKTTSSRGSDIPDPMSTGNEDFDMVIKAHYYL